MVNRLKGFLKRIIFRAPAVQPAYIKLVAPSEALRGRVALITGGTSGIGKEIARAFCQAGANVVITSRSKDRAEHTAHEISPDNVTGIQFDSSDIAKLEYNYQRLKQLISGSKIDILVNNAGLVGGDIRHTNEEEFDRIIATNLKGAFFLSKIVATDMIRNNVKGNILNIASSSSLRPAVSAYTLSKWGIRGLTEGLAKMFVRNGIVVNGLAPGPTATPMLGKSDYSDIKLPSSPIGRYALPEEIAAMAVFLCGPMGRTIVGDIVYMTGGAGIIEINDINYDFTV